MGELALLVRQYLCAEDAQLLRVAPYPRHRQRCRLLHSRVEGPAGVDSDPNIEKKKKETGSDRQEKPESTLETARIPPNFDLLNPSGTTFDRGITTAIS